MSVNHNGKTLSAMDAAVVRYGEWLLSHRLLVLIATLLMAALFVAGASQLAFKDNYRIYFGETNPHLRAFEEIQDVYTKEDNIMFVLSPASGLAFDARTLTLVEELTAAAWELPFSSRVDSVSNYQHTIADDDELVVEDLITDASSLPDAALVTAREVAVSEPSLRHRLVNPDASVTGVNVTLLLPEKELDEVAQVVRAARSLVDDMRARYPDIDIRLIGTSMMNNAFAESAKSDITKLVPVMYLVIILAILILVRCLTSALSTVVVIFVSILAALGFAGGVGINLSSPAASAPTVIMTLAVADCIHLIISMFAQMRRGLAKPAAIIDALRINMQPIFLTSLTTAIGFLTMNFSDSPPFHDLGNITAAGIMAAFVLSVTVLPVLLSLLPCRQPHGGDGDSGSRWMDSLAEFVIRRRSPLLYGGAALCLGLLAFVPANELDDRFIEYFSTNLDFRTSTDFANANLTGTYVFSFSLPAGEDNGVSDPEYLRQVEAFSEFYRAQPMVMHVATITDIFKRLNKNLHGDDPDYYSLPDDSALAAQYLFLYELSLPQGLDLTNQINLDKSASRFTVTANSMSSRQLRALVGVGETWLRDNAPELYTQGVGVSVMFAYISERNIKSMLGGSLLGLVLISAILIVALRSLKTGLLSLIPNLLPIGMTFGIWGILVGQVNLAASVVSGMVLGIVVDDTVHFLSKYLRARRENGLGPEEAVRYAFSTVGMALVVTTLILVAGFFVLTRSDFGINSVMATLTAMAIAIALIVDFLLLPPILLKFDRAPRVRDETTTETSDDKAYAAG